MKLSTSRNGTAWSTYKRGFNLIELLVVIAIIAVLVSVGIFSAARIRDASRKAASLNNLRQLGLGFTSYVADNNGFLPLSRMESSYWPSVIHPMIESSDVFLRPGSRNVPASASEPEGYFDGVTAFTEAGLPIRWNYIINGGHAALPFSEDPDNSTHGSLGYSRTMSSLSDPSRTIFISEGRENFWWFDTDANAGSVRIYRWRDGSSNVLFGDGSTRNLNPMTELTNEMFLAVKP